MSNEDHVERMRIMRCPGLLSTSLVDIVLRGATLDVLEAFARRMVSLDACFSSAYRCDWPGGDVAHNSDVCHSAIFCRVAALIL